MADWKPVWTGFWIILAIALVPALYWANTLTRRGVFVVSLPFNHFWVLAWVIIGIVGGIGVWKTIGNEGDRIVEENIDQFMDGSEERHYDDGE